MADETRDVRVKLSVDVGPEGDRALKDLEAAAKKAGEAIGRGAAYTPSKPVKPSAISSTPPGEPTQYGPARPVKPPKSAYEAAGDSGMDGGRSLRELAESSKKLAETASKVDKSKPGTTYGFADTPDATKSKAAAVAAAMNPPEEVARRGNEFARMVRDALEKPKSGDKTREAKRADEITPVGLTDERVKAIRNMQMGGIMSRVGTVQGFGQGMSEFGIPGGGMAQRAALPLALAGAAGSAALKGAQTFQDPFMTGTQKARSFIQDVVPGGSFALSVADTVSGRKAAMERAQFAGQEASVEARRRSELSSFQGSFNVAQAGRESRAAQFGRSSAVLPPGGTRATAEGERAFQEESRLYPLRVQAAKAEREATAATKERLAADQELNKLGAKARDLDTDRLKLAKSLSGEDSGPARERILQRIKVNEEETQAVANARRGAAGSQMEARQREAAARADVTRNQAAQLGAQAESAERRASTFAGSARMLGGMGAVERQQGLGALRAAKEFRLDQLPPELRQMAFQFGGEDIAKKAEREGAALPELAEFKKLAPTTYGDPEAERRKAADLTRQQAEKEFEADKALATSAAAAGKEMGKVTAEVINVLFDSFRTELKNSKLLSRSPA